MGTTYSIKISDYNNSLCSISEISTKIDSVLNSINIQMSTYIPSSEISLFNQIDVNHILPSPEFHNVLKYAQNLSIETNGLFDITVGPLVKLWGFGKRSTTWAPPLNSKINELLQNNGNETWDLLDEKLIKINPNIQIDVNAIAKGFGVDEISKLLKSTGFNNYMVEIGGEVYCSGLNESGESWRIGVELPDFDTRTMSKIVKMSNLAMATSGDYRNFYTHNGKNYSHIINPKTGKPIAHSLASATVISQTCMNADGLATALLVMGTEEALSYIESKNEVECLLIERTEAGEFKTFMSSGFGRFLSE
ncbi:MAG: FAD:protein FMN transferase [Candidatus Marinimicrobia bacterium]|nr:FAD:protein FMN transferase [Candidatus Neomarinimicrobiota bacterium]